MYENYNDIIIREYENYILLFNRMNGKWAKMSRSVFDKTNVNFSKKNVIENRDHNNLCNIENILEQGGVLIENVQDEKIITIEITNLCNLHCLHCCIDAGSEENDLTTNQLLEAIQKCLAWNPDRIVISGGEPLMRDDFSYIIMYIKKNFKGYLTLATNALLIDENNAIFIKNNFDQIDISLDGVDENSCSKVRGQGVFSRVIEKVRLLKSIGTERITLSMITDVYNKDQEEKFIQINKDLGTKPVLRAFSAVGRGREYQKNIKESISTGKVNDIYLNSKIMKSCSCKAGKSNLFVNHIGLIYPCMLLNRKEFYIGNILDIHSLDELNLEFDIHNKCMNSKDEDCKDCVFNLICWNCPAKYLEFESKLIHERCSQFFPFLNKVIRRNEN